MLGFASISNQCLVSDSPEPSLPETFRKFTFWCRAVPLSLSCTASQVDTPNNDDAIGESANVVTFPTNVSVRMWVYFWYAVTSINKLDGPCQCI